MKRIINRASLHKGVVGLLEDGTVVSSLPLDEALVLLDSRFCHDKLKYEDALKRKEEVIEAENRYRVGLADTAALLTAVHKEVELDKTETE